MFNVYKDDDSNIRLTSVLHENFSLSYEAGDNPFFFTNAWGSDRKDNGEFVTFSIKDKEGSLFLESHYSFNNFDVVDEDTAEDHDLWISVLSSIN